ncbi:MAG: hypothetical protein WBX22_18345 [Silvibacterium sp.]
MQSTRYNPPKQMILCRQVLTLMLTVVWMGAALSLAEAVEREQPVAELAKQIAAIAGPGPAKLAIRNVSSLSAEELRVIRRLLERDLREYGVLVGSADNATIIRVTLSENTSGGLWIAEVQEGTEVRVAMLPVSLGMTPEKQTGSEITLRKTLLWQQKEPMLDAMIVHPGATRRMLILEPERIVSYVMSAGAWTKEQGFAITHNGPFPRDMRGRLLPGQGHPFDAFLPGVRCTGTEGGDSLTVSCVDSDDPWPLSEPAETLNMTQQRAFYNVTRNYFTGVLAPGFGVQPRPFYGSATIPRPNGTAMLLNGIDGGVVMIENNTMKPIAGVRDWGSDLAAIRSACGSGVQVLVSGSGTAPTDGVRAYEIPGREAEPVSAPLALGGQVMAMWPSTDGTSAMVIVQTATTGQLQSGSYEVYSVSAFCD